MNREKDAPQTEEPTASRITGPEKRSSRILELHRHLHEYLDLNEGDVDRITLLNAINLPENYQKQFKFLNDKRLDDVIIAVVPDNLWKKGRATSESDAEKKLILIKKSSYETQENPDETAWMVHELAHCQKFFDLKSAEEYYKNLETYPDNPVEEYTFTKQFEFLKEHGKSRESIVGLLEKLYHEEDFPFFNRLMDRVFSK